MKDSRKRRKIEESVPFIEEKLEIFKWHLINWNNDCCGQIRRKIVKLKRKLGGK